MTRLERFALDWDSIVAAWIKVVEGEMEDARKADDSRRYRFAAYFRGQMSSARTLMLDSMSMGPDDPASSSKQVAQPAEPGR